MTMSKTTFSRKATRIAILLLSVNYAAMAVAAATPAATDTTATDTTAAATTTAPAADTGPTVADGAAAASPQSTSDSDIIVTGTRTTGLKAADSPAPIQLLGNDQLKRVGQPDLVQALAQTLPSIQAQAFGTDQAALHPEIKLRGLNPNHTLVLIDGKRRHGTANIVVNGGIYLGAAGADISLIPEDAIDHIEVLQDGAAAQYGTDAIAGVINIILKKKGSGGTFNVTGGHMIDQGGASYDVMGNIGITPIENSFLNVTVERKYADYTFRGDLDPRVVDNGVGTGVNGNSGRSILAKFPNVVNAPDYPYVNQIVGDPRYTLTNVLYNAGYDISPDVQLYSFGTYSRRHGQAFENYRLPNAAFGKSPTDFPFPLGFSPQETTFETDYAATAGVKGSFMDTTFDLSSTYGKDLNRSYVAHTANLSLYYDSSNFSTVNGVTTYNPGYTPTYIHDGDFVDSQWTNTLDLTHKFDLGLAEPLNVAGGLEYRRENYQLRAGDPASYYVGTGTLAGGTQGFFGYSPQNASDDNRNNFSEYLDLSLKPIEKLMLDGAVRHEHYSDFGNTTVWKITGRYDFSPAIAIRGTASTGFRAPTLAEEYYSGVNVSTATIAGIFAPNSPGAAALGISGLKPEKSRNYSAGIVLHPVSHLTMTLDAYSISIRNRIVQSGSFYGYSSTASTIISPSVLAALRAAGIAVDPVIAVINGPPAQSGSVSIQTFVNGASTRTQGIDYVATYSSNFGELGDVDWSLAVNYNKTKITKVNSPPSNVNQQAALLDPAAESNLTTTTPKVRVTAGAFWTVGKFSLNARESFYGPTSALTQDLIVGTQYDKVTITHKFITDLELSFQILKPLRLSVGANNLFNQYPTKYPAYLRAEQYSKASTAYVTIYPTFSPIGIDGGYYYGRLSVTF
jgi:iron complex outermembrane receptor protein